MLDALLDEVARDLDDYFVFSLQRSDTTSDLLGGTHRFSVTASLAGRPFEAFVLDVGPKKARRPTRTCSPRTTCSASLASRREDPRLHPTYEGGRSSTRTKDLIDLALVASVFPMDAAALRTEMDAVFARRAAHEPPAAVPPLPADWRGPYRRLALAVDLDLDTGRARAATPSSGSTWPPAHGTSMPRRGRLLDAAGVVPDTRHALPLTPLSSTPDCRSAHHRPQSPIRHRRSASRANTALVPAASIHATSRAR